MGANSSTSENPNNQNPYPLPTSSNMSSSSISNSQKPDPKTLENQNPEISSQSDKQDEKGRNGEGGREDGQEEGECGFCLFMKAGGCKDAFIAWEHCVEEAEKTKEDVVEKCFEVTAALKKCMEAHSDYYEPILRAEKEAEEEVKRELQRESENKNEDQNAGLKGIEERVEIAFEKEA